jgi:KipI family sensor histidine kinase inhibitor
MSTMQVLSVGRNAVLVEVESTEHAVSLASWARGRRLARDVVPGVCTVLLNGLTDREGAVGALSDWTPGTVGAGPEIEVPVTYDGPDLAAVAAAWGCEVAEVASRHQATGFVSAFCGFAPGFAYLSGLEIQVPRLVTPRTTVPAGSVALADRWCGVYPTASPGGWQIIGHTDADLWDADRAQPALLEPGTKVRFVAT